jgi:hypothetical protein
VILQILVAREFEFDSLHHPVMQIQESENTALSARVRDFTRACSSLKTVGGLRKTRYRGLERTHCGR